MRDRSGKGVLEAVLVGAAIVTAACTQSHPSSSSTTTSSSTSSTQAISTTTSSTQAAGTATCQVNQLTLSLFGSSGAAGTLESTFDFHNTSDSSCSLYGFPGAQMLNASGGVLTTQTTVRGGTYPFTDFSPSHVSLAPGGLAYFNVGYTDVPTGTESTCQMPAELEVTPPNDYSQLKIAFTASVCNQGRLTVSPVFGPGSSQTQTTAPAASG